MINLSRLASGVENVNNGFEGKWHAIEFQPDLTVPQKFVIGVAITQRGRLLHYRVADEAPRLKCFYDSRYSKDVWTWLCNELYDELNSIQGKNVSGYLSASPQITLGSGNYTSGSDGLSALNRTFERVVTVTAQEKKPRTQGVSQSELRSELSLLLKLRLSNRYEQISQPEGGMRIPDRATGAMHTLDVTYDDTNIASSAVSASYASHETARLNVVTALNDLETLKRLRGKPQIGIAVLFPSVEYLHSEVIKSWKQWWDEQAYFLRESNRVLIAEGDSAESLADQICDWYPALN